MDPIADRATVLDVIKHIEHPEISETLLELGMILDVVIIEDTVKVAMALPRLVIPEVVKNMLTESIREPIQNLGLKTEVEFFEMSEEIRNRFFYLASTRWKGSV